MRKFLLLMTLVLGIGVMKAEEPIEGIFATYDGAKTSYKLEDVPQVSYTTEGGVTYAVLSFRKTDTRVQFALEEGKSLVITYGEYQEETGTESVRISTEDGRKIIRGGRLIIVKGGKMYDASGRMMNEE